MTTADKRKSQLAMIHVAKKQLGLTDDTYRALLRQVVGVESAGDLDDAGLTRVLKHLKSLGFKTISRKPGVGRKPTPALPRQALISKIEALLADSGRAWAYADGMAQRMFQVEKVDWLNSDQLWRMVGALEIDKRRRTQREAT